MDSEAKILQKLSLEITSAVSQINHSLQRIFRKIISDKMINHDGEIHYKR